MNNDNSVLSNKKIQIIKTLILTKHWKTKISTQSRKIVLNENRKSLKTTNSCTSSS